MVGVLSSQLSDLHRSSRDGKVISSKPTYPDSLFWRAASSLLHLHDNANFQRHLWGETLHRKELLHQAYPRTRAEASGTIRLVHSTQPSTNQATVAKLEFLGQVSFDVESEFLRYKVEMLLWRVV